MLDDILSLNILFPHQNKENLFQKWDKKLATKCQLFGK